MQIHYSIEVALNLLSIAALVTNTEGRIVVANMPAERMFGYSHNELVGQTLEVLLPHRIRHRHGAYCAGYFSDLQRRSMGVGTEVFALRKDGTEFPVDIILSGLNVNEDLLALSLICEASDRNKRE